MIGKLINKWKSKFVYQKSNDNNLRNRKYTLKYWIYQVEQIQRCQKIELYTSNNEYIYIKWGLIFRPLINCVFELLEFSLLTYIVSKFPSIVA